MYKNGSLVVAAVISIAVHAMAAVYLGSHDVLRNNSEESQSPVSFLQISLTPNRPAAAKPKPPPTPEARHEPEPLPPPKPVPKPVVRKRALPAPVSKPHPANRETETPEPPRQAEELIVASTRIDAPADAPALAQVAQEKERESYLQRLLAHIDSHKFYPRSARRHGVEGEIQVSFYLLGDGRISKLEVKGDSKILRQAARQAVEQALSLPPPPESMPLQEPVRFGMVYRLDDGT